MLMEVGRLSERVEDDLARHLEMSLVSTVPETALPFGFKSGPSSAHTSRTIMLSELRLLLDSLPGSPGAATYRRAIVDENVLLKVTATTRLKSWRCLHELYALDPNVLVFRSLLDLWLADLDAQPLLALLCAAARDAIVRATSDLVLSSGYGAAIGARAMEKAVAAAYPARYNSTTLSALGRNLASSWAQSGHLAGHVGKVRIRANCLPPAAAFAFLLGYLCGARGEGLFETIWAKLLDLPIHSLREQAIAASQHGWLEYRHAGQVTEISFRHLLRDVELPQ